jgi:hypothetical protein
MFSRISQIGKNITDELENVVNAANSRQASGSRPNNANGTGEVKAQNQMKLLEKNAHILERQTPEPSSLELEQGEEDEQLEKEAVNEDAKDDGEKVENSSSIAPQKASDDVDTVFATTDGGQIELPKEIVSKLKKFNKYEEKYPGE